MIRMREEITLLYEILGLGRKGVLEMACAIRVAEQMLFSKGLAVDDVHVTTDIYPRVAKELNKHGSSVMRQIQRIGNECWNSMDAKMKKKYIGKDLKDIRAPKDMIFYFAYYVHFQRGYYEVLEKNPSILFGHIELPIEF